MRRIILLSTVLFATPFGIDCYAEDCVNSNCQTLGYTYPTNIGGCLQCPFGNYWFCPGNDDYCPNLGTLDSCPKGYKCEYEECSGKYYKVDGCQDSYVWDAEAKTCTCPNLGTLDSCPKGYKCVYEACSGKYYKVDGCQDSYVWDANAKTCTCPNKGNLSSCPTGYKCVYEACSGKYYKVDGCASGYDWNASSKTCTEHCYYSCSLASCPAHGNCSYENCTGKYCLYSCQTGYNLEGNSCVCPNKCSQSSCPTGWECDKESCSGKYCPVKCASGYDSVNGNCVLHQHTIGCSRGYIEENKWGDYAKKAGKICTTCYAPIYGQYCYKGPDSGVCPISGKRIRIHDSCSTTCSKFSNGYAASMHYRDVCRTDKGDFSISGTTYWSKNYSTEAECLERACKEEFHEGEEDRDSTCTANYNCKDGL